MWEYRQIGELWYRDATGASFVEHGYSGAGIGKNNAAMENIHSVGPIPRGLWEIQGPPVDTPTHGPYVLRLAPSADTNTFGRDLFRIHGDSIKAPGTASQGCIILPRAIRERIWQSNDRQLTVI